MFDLQDMISVWLFLHMRLLTMFVRLLYMYIALDKSVIQIITA